ncbi:rotatin [Euwallacea similis]|uniref:rotatin n=1 Tax=Euwallacea similis TaxID=1736056 RepID=UPI00344B9B0C
MCESESYISSAMIQKLTHKIAEIRERALLSLISKLDNGFVFDNDLSRSRELLFNLFNWFLFEPCTSEDLVLDLIKRILQSPAGKILICHIGKTTIQSELEKIKSFISPKFHEKINDIFGILKTIETPIFDNVPSVVPPLKNDIPLSYRSSCGEEWTVSQSHPVIQTATTIEGLVQKGSSHQLGYPQTVVDETIASNNPTYRLDESSITHRPTPVHTLKWQPLIETDRNVLQSVENSLKNPDGSSMLYHSCEFFINVLLHDFPAEVFIQRPGIVIILYELLSTCHSTRLNNIILQCFYDLTKALQVRINHCNDPCMQNFKTEMLPNLESLCTTPSLNRHYDIEKPSINDKFELVEETKILKNNAFTVPDYCFRTMNIVLKCMSLKVEGINEHKPKLNHAGQAMSLNLLNEIVNLLNCAIGENLWKDQVTTDNLSVLKETNNSLSLYGDTLQYFRIESLSLENNLICRVIYLHLLCISVKWLKCLIPLPKSNLIFPKNFKLSLSNSLLDISLGRLYPKIHKCLLQYVESFSSSMDKNSLNKYENTMKVCNGLTTTVKFLRNAGKATVAEKFRLAYSAIPGVEFHRNLQFLSSFVDLCADMLYSYRDDLEIVKLAQDTLLQLLAHRIPEIQEETYRLCHRKVIDNIATQMNFTAIGIPGSPVYFLLHSEIITEIALFGLRKHEVKRLAEEILLYVLKCKAVVAELIWDSCIQALIPVLPIILCYAENSSNLGRTIVNVVDPDTAKVLLIPEIVMLKSNIELLFADNSTLRDEAFSRLCWLLAKQENSRDVLPKFNTIFDKAMSNACCIKRAVVDINKMRKSEHFYQPSSLDQVLDLLKSENVEPVIRRSALNQISVMMDDYLLHEIFIDSSGLTLMVHLMRRALQENDFRDYPDSIIPIVSILKSVALYHSSVREELSANMDVFYYTLRGLFLFFTDDRMRLEGSILLFLLTFKDYIRGSPAKATFSIPNLLDEKLCVPFIANTHLNASSYSPEDLFTGITQDKWSLSSLQVQWHADIYDGLNNLINVNDAKFSLPEDLSLAANDILTLQPQDLAHIKSSSIHYCIKKYLYMIQSATSHEVVQDSITKLVLYLQFYQISSQLNDNQDNQLLSHPWEESFTRYLEVLPSSDEDIVLLIAVIKLLIVLVPMYKDSVKDCWITKFLKDPTHCLLDVLAYENNVEEDTKLVSQNLLKMLTMCVTLEYRYLDYYTPKEDKPNNWHHVIKIISENLQYNNRQHFYNLAYLDALLSCLVHLTARLGWSQDKTGPIPQLISSLCELLTAFHCGKGATAAISVMGLSISRNVLFILNHLLAELQHCKIKRWEQYFFDEETRPTKSFLAMWASRDAILRAAAVQLVSNLSNSPIAAQEIINDLSSENGNIWQLSISIVTDHSEASIVRENAALLLSNLCLHISYESNNGVATVLSPSFLGKRQDIPALLEEFDFYNHLDVILTTLFTLDYSLKSTRPLVCLRDCGESQRSRSSSSVPREIPINATTPGFIKAISVCLSSIIDISNKEVYGKLHESGLIKLIFRTMCLPSISIDNKKELALYCNILEMNTSVCSLLRKLCSYNTLCTGTVLHTRDCINVLFSLLNAKNFHTHLPQLLYIRNKLWSEIFNLIAVLLESFNDDDISPRKIEGLSIISETIEQTGVEQFLDALCESLGSVGSNDLQNSTLILLVSLLRVECDVAMNKTHEFISMNYSIENILDTVRSPKTVIMATFRDNFDDMRKDKTSSLKTSYDSGRFNRNKSNLLEEAYFGQVIKHMRPESAEESDISIIDNSEDALMVGAELCKILIYLFDIITIKITGDGQINKKKSLVIAALTGILCISQEAKRQALEKHLLETTIKELREFHIRLTLESVENLRRVQDKKRIVPVLQEIADLIGLLTNFMLNNSQVKTLAASFSLADVVHKLWVWFLFQSSYIVDVLRLLSVYTLDCPQACRSLPLTSAIAGTGPRKTPSNLSLLHSIISVISKEMEQVSKSHDLSVLELAFDVLHHCCDILECRVVISKSNLFQAMSRMHPAATKRQFPWDNVELLWLEFLQTYTRYSEGQSAIAKENDLLDVVIGLAHNSKEINRQQALMVLRNVTFYQPNRPRLLSSGDFLNLLQLKLSSGTCEEKKTVVVIMWSLAANNQKAKLIFKSAKLDSKLENLLKCARLLGNAGDSYGKDDLELMDLVLSILRGSDKTRYSK